MELLAQLPPSEVENHAVWHHILLRALSQDTRRRVETEMISLTQKVLADWQNGGYKLGQVERVVRTTSKLSCVGIAHNHILPDFLFDFLSFT